MIRSISYSQTEIIKSIMELYIKDTQFDIDPTYSKGVFYKNIPEPRFCSDIDPPADKPHVHRYDCRQLPFDASTVHSIIFDPPFVVGIPNKSRDKVGSNLIKNRFGAVKDIKTLYYDLYQLSMVEFYRILKPGGFLVFKCQDTVSSGKNHFSHCEIYNMAMFIGYIAVDLFILLAKSRMSSGRWKTQQHARKYHSYFWVFQKPTK